MFSKVGVAGITLLSAACATVDVPAKELLVSKASVFDEAIGTFDTVRAAGKLCRLHHYTQAADYQCPGQVDEFDREACLRFDQAIQPALKPLRHCAEASDSASASEFAAQCEAYIDRFLQPCLGVHAVQMAYKDNSLSKDYRDAVAAGMDEEKAKKEFLSDLVRYRD